MRRLVIIPDGWDCTIDECRPGHFLHGDVLGFKSEYSTHSSATCSNGGAFNSAGEYFHTPLKGKTVVQPVSYVWEEYEE